MPTPITYSTYSTLQIAYLGTVGDGCWHLKCMVLSRTAMGVYLGKLCCANYTRLILVKLGLHAQLQKFQHL